MCLYISKLIKRSFIAQDLICVHPRPICNSEMRILCAKMNDFTGGFPVARLTKLNGSPLNISHFLLQNADAKRKETDGKLYKNALSIHGSVWSLEKKYETSPTCQVFHILAKHFSWAHHVVCVSCFYFMFIGLMTPSSLSRPGFLQLLVDFVVSLMCR